MVQSETFGEPHVKIRKFGHGVVKIIEEFCPVVIQLQPAPSF